MSQGSPSPISSSKSPSSDETHQERVIKRFGRTTAKMLWNRELYGNVITSVKGRYNFREEYTKKQVSEPTIWSYGWTDTMACYTLEQLNIDTDIDLIISGGIVDGALSFGLVVKDTQEDLHGNRCTPDCVWPPDIDNKKWFAKSPGELWPLDLITVDDIFSSISCIKKFGNPGQHKFLITAGRSEQSGGCACILNIESEFGPAGLPMIDRDMDQIALFKDIVWTADCNPDGSQAIIGTSNGAALVDVETGTQSWVCRCKSDILSVQLDPTEKIALCGLRNGVIVTIDVRQRPDSHARLTRQRILLHSGKCGELSSRSSTYTMKHWFELKGSIYYSDTISTPSSISCLASLKLYDQYFLASSMDGSMKLYDHRMVQRGAVQSYEGNVNSSTRIQFAVDPSEKYVMSGGEDGKLRLWSIKSGELLFEELFLESIPSAVCWLDKGDNWARGEAWVGSEDGDLLCICWP